MNEGERLAEVRRWMRYALEDLATAEALLEHTELAPRHVCFLSQQAAEKALKAVLVAAQVDIPRHHDLNAVCALIPDRWQAGSAAGDLSGLTQWAVEARYPEDWPEATAEDARQAVREARLVCELVRDEMAARGIPVADAT